jgi:hypothetical protein
MGGRRANRNTPDNASIAMRRMGRKSRGADSEIAENLGQPDKCLCNGRKALRSWEQFEMARG